MGVVEPTQAFNCDSCNRSLKYKALSSDLQWDYLLSRKPYWLRWNSTCQASYTAHTSMMNRSVVETIWCLRRPYRRPRVKAFPRSEFHMHDMQGSNINDAVVPPSSLTRRSRSIFSTPRPDFDLHVIYRYYARRDLDPRRCMAYSRVNASETPARVRLTARYYRMYLLGAR